MKETATLEFRSESQQALDGIKRLEGKLDELGQQSASMGERAASSTGKWVKGLVGVAAAYVSVRGAMSFMGSSLKAHQDLEQAMLNYRMETGASAAEVDALRGSVLKMANDSGIAMADAFSALKEVTGAGFAPDAGGLGVLAEAINLSKIAALDLDTAVNMVNRTMLAYELTADQAARATSALFGATRDGNLQMEEIVRSFQMVAPEARALNLQLEDVAASLVVLTNAGRTGKQATAELGAVFNTLIKPGEKLWEVIDQLDLKMLSAEAIREHGFLPALQELREVMDLQPESWDWFLQFFGSAESAMALSELVKSTEDFSATLESLAANSTAAADAAAILDSGFTGTLARLGATWTNTKALIGEGLAAILIGPLQRLQEGLDEFSIGLEQIKEKYRAVMAAGGTEAEASRAAWDEFVVQWQTHIIPALEAGWDMLKDKLATIPWSQILQDTVIGAFKLMIDVLQGLWNSFWENLPSIVAGAVKLALDLVVGLFDGILQKFTSMMDGLLGYQSALSALINGRSDGKQYGGEVGRQYGGMIGAPDRVPARLAVGEHVMRREVSQSPGMGDLFNALNTMGPAALNVYLPNVTNSATALQVAPRLASGMSRFGGGGMR